MWKDKEAYETVVVWTSAADYSRFLEVVGPGEYPDTFAGFLLQAADQFAQLGVDPTTVHKFVVDPYDMRDWCLEHHGRVDSDVRALYALTKFREMHGKGDGAVH